MKVLSVNRSKVQSIEWNGKIEVTGYFKTSVDEIFVSKNGVVDDEVADLVHHGGEDKACYLFGYNHYEFWQKQYPHLTYNYGMFGENITVDLLNEAELKIGDVLKIGNAELQITQPRQPCYKMGIKFNDQTIVNTYRKSHTPGIYVRVLKEGKITTNDTITLIESDENAQSVLEVYRLIYADNPSTDDITRLVENKLIAQRLKNYIMSKFKLS